MRVKVEETPQDIRRRVATKLESIRGTPMAEGADGAHLGKQACPIYRPDIKGVAYWEFDIEGVKGTKAREHEGKSSGFGFMLASTGAHDFPIPHWSLTNEPPSRALEAKAAKAVVGKVTKLDSLAYVAEDAAGKYLTHLGQFPPQIAAGGVDIATQRGISTATATPATPTKDDSSPTKLVIENSGAKVPDLKLVAWETWPAAKRGYAGAYKPLLDALATRAVPAWQAESLIAQFGEGILEGQLLTVPLLKPGKASITGDGLKFVKMTLLNRQPPALTLEALPSGTRQEINFQLVISYEDGASETLPFFIVPKGTPSNHRSVLPHFVTSPNVGGIRL